jgi:uncharacterized C2H2 Zn-finger protein
MKMKVNPVWEEVEMKKCPDCGKAFKSPQAVATHRTWAHGSRRLMARKRAKVGKLPIARHRANTRRENAGRPQVIVRVGERDLTPQEFTKLVDEMLVVRAALRRVR